MPFSSKFNSSLNNVLNTPCCAKLLAIDVCIQIKNVPAPNIFLTLEGKLSIETVNILKDSIDLLYNCPLS